MAKIRMLRRMCNLTLRDRIGNDSIRKKVGVTCIKEKIKESRFRWFGHICIRLVITIDDDMCGRRRGRGRPEKSWREIIKNDHFALRLTKDLAIDMIVWRCSTRVGG